MSTAPTESAIAQPFILPLRAPFDGPASAGAPLRAPLHFAVAPGQRPIVRPGDLIIPGQRIAESIRVQSVHLHAPVGARVVSVSHTDIGLEPAPLDRPPQTGQRPTRPNRLGGAGQLIQRVHEAGVCGLGGARYPSAVKLAAPFSQVLINAVECEPGAAGDVTLLRHAQERIAAALASLVRCIGTERGDFDLPVTIMIGAEFARERPGAAAALAARWREAFGADTVPLPVWRLAAEGFPAGAEASLLPQLVAGLPPTSRQRATELGVLSLNLQTLLAIDDAARGLVLSDRLVTLTNTVTDAVTTARLPIGISARTAAAALGLIEADATPSIRIGGRLSGRLVDHHPAPTLPWYPGADGPPAGLAHNQHPDAIDAGTIAVVFEPPPPPIAPCIRCARCAEACPRELAPQLIVPAAIRNDWSMAGRLGLADCYRCGACEAVCPSAIPLLSQLEDAQARQRELAAQTRAAELAQARSARKANRDRDRQQHDSADARRAARRAARQRRNQSAPNSTPDHENHL